MTNVKDNGIDLGLALSINSQCLASLSNNDTSNIYPGEGAGANANANSNSNTMTFARSSPLTELIWSPQNGLSVKCADKKPSLSQSCSGTKDEKHHVVGPENQRTFNLLPLFTNNPQKVSAKVVEDQLCETGGDGLGFDIGSPVKIQAMTQWMVHKPIKMSEDKSKADGCSRALYVEAAAENDDISRNELGKLIPREKSAYCREGDKRASYGSMESCSSANLLSKRNRMWSFDQQLILGSKRLKEEAQEFPFLTPTVKQDSSFMNWISNMVKGLKPEQEEAHSLALTVHENYEQKASRKLGFQTVFQSLYAPDVKGHDQEPYTLIENNSVGSSKELVLADEMCLDDVKYGLSSIGSSPIIKKGADLGSLWTTRLFPETPSIPLSSNHSDLKTFVPKDLYGFKKVDDNIHKVPKEMFDTIRKLRLSRTDILKWTNSDFSVRCLDGFFLRLRLAKWEKGAGAAGYYVACITESQGEKTSRGSTKPIRVSVGGIECLVESRYVSNCDFLEDELVAWWQKTLRSGRVPMEVDLNSKLEERKKLGL